MSKHVQCLSIVLVYVVFAHPNPAWSSDYDWYVYNMNEYALTQNFGTWESCQAEANSVGGHLATICDANENAWLTEFIRYSGVQSDPDAEYYGYNLAWIGYYHPAGSVWEWITGEPVDYTNYYYSYWYDPYLYAYIHGARHTSPGTWNNNCEHYTYEYMYPRGIIELDGVYQLALHVTRTEWGSVIVEPNLPFYEPNTTVTLTVEPTEGKYWGGWQGDVPAGHEFDNPLVITMDSDKNIATAFKCGFGMGPMLPLTTIGLLGVFLVRRRGS